MQISTFQLNLESIEYTDININPTRMELRGGFKILLERSTLSLFKVTINSLIIFRPLRQIHGL